LPHTLIEAFRATLEEVQQADLLLHVIDASDELRQDKIIEVNEVLAQIGAEDRPQILVYNKIDKLNDNPLPRIEETGDNLQRVWLSALTGEGMAELTTAIAQHMQAEIVRTHLHLPPSAGRLRAALFELQAIIDDAPLPTGGWAVTICLRRHELEQLCHKQSIDWQDYIF